MIRALIGGSKTQTRRVVKPPRQWASQYPILDALACAASHAAWWWDGLHDRVGVMQRCPYGKPGDLLWVRENGWQRPERTPKMMREGADTWAPYYFDADGYGEADAEQFKAWGFKRRPSIHMPRWASRITLEITEVRVERLQDISEADAIAEGIERIGGDASCTPWRNYDLPDGAAFVCHCAAPSSSYRSLWEQINGAGSWEANPWVWVVEFKRVMPNASLRGAEPASPAKRPSQSDS